MGLVPYNFDPEYSVEDIDSRKQLITETTAQPFRFLYDSNIFFQNVNNLS